MDFSKTEWYLFILAAILIAAVYYVGVKTDIQAFSNAFNTGFNVITGRNAAGGAFQNVPK
jgi:hypothetical protein